MLHTLYLTYVRWTCKYINKTLTSHLLHDQDIAPQYAGILHGKKLRKCVGNPFSFAFYIMILSLTITKTITGISNSAGTLAAIISTIGTGYFVQWLGSFQAFLTVTAVLYVVTTIFWNLFATGEQVLWLLYQKKKIPPYLELHIIQSTGNCEFQIFIILYKK